MTKKKPRSIKKNNNLTSLIQLPPSSSSSINGDDFQETQSSVNLDQLFNKNNPSNGDQYRVRRKPHRSSNDSFNVNEETIRSSPSGNLVGGKKNHNSNSNSVKVKQINIGGHLQLSSSVSSTHNKYQIEDNEITYPELSNYTIADKKNVSLNDAR